MQNVVAATCPIRKCAGCVGAVGISAVTTAQLAANRFGLARLEQNVFGIGGLSHHVVNEKVAAWPAQRLIRRQYRRPMQATVRRRTEPSRFSIGLTLRQAVSMTRAGSEKPQIDPRLLHNRVPAHLAAWRVKIPLYRTMTLRRCGAVVLALVSVVAMSARLSASAAELVQVAPQVFDSKQPLLGYLTRPHGAVPGCRVIARL
jgi:hypothetical protein